MVLLFMTAVMVNSRHNLGLADLAEILALWSERLHALRPRGVASVVAALAIHGLVAVSLLAIWDQAGQTEVEREAPPSITVSVIEAEPAPAPEASTPAPVDREAARATPPPAAPARREPSTQAPQPEQTAQTPQPVRAQERSDAPALEPPSASEILTAEGGQAAFAPDPPQANTALRGVVCSTGSSEMRAAVGCSGPLDGAADRFTAYADSAQAAQIGQMFSFAAEDTAFTGFTVDFSGRHTPGQIFSQHSHFASGAHTALGQLPVAERARDPGFGD